MIKTNDGWFIYKMTKGSFEGWKRYDEKIKDDIWVDLHLGRLASSLLRVKSVYPHFNLESNEILMWITSLPFFHIDIYGIKDDGENLAGVAYIVSKVEIPWIEEGEINAKTG